MPSSLFHKQWLFSALDRAEYYRTLYPTVSVSHVQEEIREQFTMAAIEVIRLMIIAEELCLPQELQSIHYEVNEHDSHCWDNYRSRIALLHIILPYS